MPIRVSYPGVYVEEVPGGQPVTAGVSTSSTAFVDFFSRGPMNKAVRVASMGDFNRVFGGLHLRSEASYGIKQYFLNGGQEAWVVRAGDGTAKSAILDVRVKTPGLANRFQWAAESATIADKAQQAAHDAAAAAKTTLDTIDTEKDTAQELEQKSAELRGKASESASETLNATAATRDAAIQAKASSDELAIAIAALAAASGPVAGRTVQAAQHSADAATASSAAATSSKDVIAAAQVAVDAAKKALRQSQLARSVQGAAEELAEVQKAIDAAKAAVAKTADFQKAAQGAKELTPAAQAATQAAASATEAVEQAATAVRGAQAMLGTLDGLTPDSDTGLKGEIKEQLAALAGLDLASFSSDAVSAGLSAQTAVDLEDAQAAATAAKEVADAAEAAGNGAGGGPVVVAEAAVEFAGQKLPSIAATVAKDAAAVGDTVAKTAETGEALAGQELAEAQAAVDAAKAAVAEAETQKKAADAVTEDAKLGDAQAAAGQAAAAAIEAAAQAKAAVQGTLAVLEKLKDETGVAAQITALKALDVDKPGTDAAAAKSAVEAADDLAKTKTAAGAAKTAADSTKALTDATATAITAGNTALTGMEAEKKAALPGKEAGAVAAAMMAILQANDAAKKAMVAAKLASADAKVAASAVGSAAVNLAAREAVSGTEKAGNRTAAALKQAKAVIAQLSQALITAKQAVKPATEAAEAAADDKAGNQESLAAAQAALNVANNSLAAAETVEKAAVEVANMTLEATLSADLAARSAKVAVDANEEAGRPPTLRIAATNEGIWGDNLQVDIEVQGAEFALTVSEFVTERGVSRRVTQEAYSRLNLEKDDKRFAVEMLNQQSKLMKLDYIGPMVTGAYPEEVDGKFLGGGADGGIADATQLTGADGALMALEDIQPAIFNLLCLPSVGSMPGGQATVAIANANAYCAKKRAFFIVDIPSDIDTTDKMLEWVDEYGNAQAYHMAVYFPRLVIPDPLQDFRPRNVGPSGTLAGVYARTDSQRGVWKAPAGINAVLQGVEVASKITDDQNGLLNPRGVNVLRSFPIYGNISWGARTLAGADAISSEWKYINVRRLLNYIEESLFQSLKWAVFEPNGEELWSKIRMQVATFLAGLFSQGAFQGTGEGTSYFVVCDGSTTTPVDIDFGVVNVDIGVAPAKPAEFVVLHFQQIAGQSA